MPAWSFRKRGEISAFNPWPLGMISGWMRADRIAASGANETGSVKGQPISGAVLEPVLSNHASNIRIAHK